MFSTTSLETSVLNAVVSSCKLRAEADATRRTQARRAAKVAAPLGSLAQPTQPDVHRKAREDRYEREEGGCKRLAIDDERMVPWSAPWVEPPYEPPTYEAPLLARFSNPGRSREERRAQGKERWADRPAPLDADLAEEVRGRTTYENGGRIVWDEAAQLPRNPRGRTGLAGRGLLGKWGPNHAADPIVTRLHPATNQLQMVAIERKDMPGQWAIPGGMVDEGELVSVAVKREFIEEAGNISESDEAKQAFVDAINHLFSKGGHVVYRGYVDDPRTTDNAWIETTAFHFHCPPELGDKLPLGAGDDANRAIWLDVNPATEERYANLYASHRQWVDRVAETIAPHERARQNNTERGYPARLAVPDEKVPWSGAWTEYNPEDYTDLSVLGNYEGGGAKRWADPPDPLRVERPSPAYGDEPASMAPSADANPVHATDLTADGIAKRLTFEGPITFDESRGGGYGRPHNPRGRTGLAGRGLLGKWGPNHAADPIVTRWHPATNKLQVVVVKR